MGWVLERASKTGAVRYTAMYRDLAGHKRSAGTFTTERKAAAEWAKAEGAQAAGRVGDRRRGRQPLRQYAEAWFRDHVIEETTRETYRSSLDKHVLPELGDLPLREFLPSDIRAWVLTLTSRGVGAPTIRRCKAILDSIFTTALNDQIIAIHPGKGVKTPPVAKKPKRLCGRSNRASSPPWASW